MALFYGFLQWYIKGFQLLACLIFFALPLSSSLSSLLPSIFSPYPQLLFILTLIPYRLYQRHTIPPPSPPTLETLKAWDTFAHGNPIRRGTFQTRDDVTISYSMVGTGKKVFLAANGLGCSAVFGVPIMDLICTSDTWEEYQVITWDYRGLFASTGGSEALPTTYFSIRDNAMDGMELLKHLGYDDCYCMFGYSTGVQVALEFAAMYPTCVDCLVLLNGTSKHLISSLLQPLFRLPFLNEHIHELLHLSSKLLITPPDVYSTLKSVVFTIITTFRYLVLKPICFLTNSNYEFFVTHYILEFFSSPTHSRNYLKYPAALDCHSAYHLLPEITQPTLIVSGMLDILTPAYASYEMNKLLPNSELHCETFGTHFVLLEYPDKCGKWIKEFLERGWGEVKKGEVKNKKERRSRSRSKARKNK